MANWFRPLTCGAGHLFSVHTNRCGMSNELQIAQPGADCEEGMGDTYA